MTGTSFKGATLAKAKFMGSILKNCDFTNARLYQTDWTHAHFARCKFSDNLANQRLRELCISRIGTNEDFSSNNLSDLNLIGVNLRAAILVGANLNSTNLTQADLENTNLVNVQAIQTDFTKANLSGACIENWAITSETILPIPFAATYTLTMPKKNANPQVVPSSKVTLRS
ncbi:MAG: pentapeptide repeat-containing protein [Pseudanabaena sp. ELA748]